MDLSIQEFFQSIAMSSEHEFAPATVTDNADAAEVHPLSSESQDLSTKTTKSQPAVGETEQLVVTTKLQDMTVQLQDQEPVVVTIYLTSGSSGK